VTTSAADVRSPHRLRRIAPALGTALAVGLAAAVELSRALGRLPARLVVVGVEVAPTPQALAAGAGLSAAVAAAVEPAAVAAVLALG
jgi:hydrogenase maturation protease